MDNIKTKILDATTLLTIAGILLFNLGWIYWTSFYQYFKIDSSLIDIPFDRIIATSWYYILIVIGSFSMVYMFLFNERNNNGKLNLVSAISLIIDSIILLLAGIDIIDLFWFITLFLISSIVFILLIFLFRHKNVNLKILPVTFYKYIIIFVIYVLSLIFYNHLGLTNARNLVRNYSEDIELTLTLNNSKLTGKLIASMKNKYFILKKINYCQTELFIINESDVVQVKTRIDDCEF